MHSPAQLRPRRLLQSWKEIAGYLDVTVRTVQRWEKESALPIHRQGSGRKARVVAYSDEFDSWLHQEKGLQNHLLSDVSSPFFDFTQGREYAYLLFPRIDVFGAEGDLPVVNQMSVTSDRRILIRVSGAQVHAFYYLDFDLHLVDSRFADNLVSVHDRLWRFGLLDHAISEPEMTMLRGVARFATAPDGNSPDVEAPLKQGNPKLGLAKIATR